jgi:hypothetical protein
VRHTAAVWLQGWGERDRDLTPYIWYMLHGDSRLSG